VPFYEGVFVCVGLFALGYQISQGIIYIKSLDSAVTVKELSEREVPADIAIWPITFQEAGNDLNELFSGIQQKNALVMDFLASIGTIFNRQQGQQCAVHKKGQGGFHD